MFQLKNAYDPLVLRIETKITSLEIISFKNGKKKLLVRDEFAVAMIILLRLNFGYVSKIAQKLAFLQINCI